MRIALVALALAWLGVTGWAFEAGRRAEHEHRTLVEALGSEGGLEARVARHDRGLFASEATTVLGPAVLPEGATRTARLVLRHRIDHGPYPLAWIASGGFDGRPVRARVETVATLELEDETVIEEVPLPLVVRTVFGADGGAALTMTPDPDARFEDPELSADWAAVRAELAFGPGGADATGALVVPRVAFDGRDGAAFALEGLLVDFDVERADASVPVWVGASRLHVARLALAGPDGAVTLHDLALESTSDVTGGRWSMRLDASLGGSDGPDGRLDGGELVLGVSGLALGPLAELEALGAVMEAEGPASDAAKLELMTAAGALWPELMAAGPTVEIPRLRVATPDGEVRMAFRAGVDASEPALLVHPLTSLPALEVDLELSLPQAVLEGWLAAPRPVLEADAAPWVMPAELASQRVATWLERGHLDRHEGRYVTTVRLRQGVVRLNGRVVSFDAL